jgi:hypothetical protein
MANKKLTATQVKAIYNAGLRAFMNSNAMLVDDILTGVKPRASAYGKLACNDSLWFQAMALHIWKCIKWESLSDTRRGNIIALVNLGK